MLSTVPGTSQIGSTFAPALKYGKIQIVHSPSSKLGRQGESTIFSKEGRASLYISIMVIERLYANSQRKNDLFFTIFRTADSLKKNPDDGKD